MPSKDDILVSLSNTGNQNAAMPESKDIYSTDVEELVAAIKHNLRLKSRSCHSLCSKSKRMSPYDVPGRTCKHKGNSQSPDKMQCHSACSCVGQDKQHKSRKVLVQASDDPYEMLQELLKEGSLIKEAVKRLQCARPASKENTDFYEFDCSVCDLPAINMRTIEL